MNDEANTDGKTETDDTEGHMPRVRFLTEAETALADTGDVEDAEGHAASANRAAKSSLIDSAGEADDTEGNCFKYRDPYPVGRPDDTQGHGQKNSG